MKQRDTKKNVRLHISRINRVRCVKMGQIQTQTNPKLELPECRTKCDKWHRMYGVHAYIFAIQYGINISNSTQFVSGCIYLFLHSAAQFFD